MNNRTTIMIAMVAVVMMAGMVSAATIPDWDKGVVIANDTHNLTIGFNTTNATVVNGSEWCWNINITNPTGEDFQWISINVWNGTDWTGPVAGNNTTFLANSSNIADTTGWTYGISNTSNYNAIISLRTTNSTVHLNGFDVNVSNSGNASEWAKLSSLNFTAGPVVAAQSSLVNVSASAVANGTDKMPMRLALRDANDNPVLSLSTGPTITAENLNVTGAAGTTSTPSTINQTTGNVTFDITATKAGAYNVTAVCDGQAITNTTTVFVAGPAHHLAIFGPDGSTPDATTIKQDVAIQDAYDNNVTEHLTPAYFLTASIISGSASVAAPNTLTVTSAEVTNVAASGVNYSSAFGLVNFTINDALDETVTFKVQGNGSLLSATKDLTYYGSVHHLDVTVNETSMYANGGIDAILVTVQLKDSGDHDVKSAGIGIQLGTDDSALFGTLGSNDTDADGTATFVVVSGTKAGSDEIDATTTTAPAGKVGSSPAITLLPALTTGNCAVVNSTAGIIVAGETSVITATVNDAAGTAMASYSVTFNLTSGDGTFADGTTLCTATTDTNGNATATVTSTNASTTLIVNVTAPDENGVAQQLGNLQNFDVVPNVVAKIAVSPSTSVGLKNEVGTPQVFVLQFTDTHNNNNTTVANIFITTDNEDLGLINNGTATNYTNNVTVTTAAGAASFTYYVNSSTADTAVLTLNATTLGVVQSVTITTTDPTGIALVFDALYPRTGTTVNATATLTDDAGNALAISGKILTFTTRNAAGTLVNYTEIATDANGQAKYDITQTVAGVYTVAVSNATMGLSATNTTTFVGTAASVVAAVNATSVNVNDTVAVNATIKDTNGYTTSDLNGETIRFMIDTVTIDTVTIANGVAATTYTTATAGDVTILAFYNGTLQDSVTVTFTTEAVLSVDTIVIVTPASPVTMNVTDDPLTFTAECYNDSTGTTPLTGITVTWDSSNTTVGIDPATGMSTTFTALANGTTTITATADGKSDTVEVTVGAEAVAYDSADTNQNCVVDLTELMAQIGRWKIGTIGLTEMMTSIGRWKVGSGGYC